MLARPPLAAFELPPVTFVSELAFRFRTCVAFWPSSCSCPFWQWPSQLLPPPKNRKKRRSKAGPDVAVCTTIAERKAASVDPVSADPASAVPEAMAPVLVGGFGPGLGGGQYGSAFNQGGSFQTGAEGNRYGQGGFNYNVGGSKRRDYGNVQTYGDRESFGLNQNEGANRATGQSSFGNEYKNQEQGSGGQQFSSGFSG
ncbi:hypothetical protein MTO96_047793 [Rhipicephalus appendiculatus]